MAPATAVAPLRVLSWNIAFGQGTDGVRDYNRSARWIANINPDIVAICEIPSDKISELVSSLNQHSGISWFAHFVPKFDGTTEGNLILSKFPFASTSGRFLSFARSVAQASINVGGRNVNFFATHLDDGSSAARDQQVVEMTGWAANFAAPRIICGDFNGGPDTPEASRMSGQYSDSWSIAMNLGAAVSYPDNPIGIHTRTRRGRIDYVFYAGSSSDLVLRRAQILDSRDLSNPNVVIRLGTLDDLGVRPSDHNHMIADFELDSTAPAPTPTPTPVPTPTPTPTPTPVPTPTPTPPPTPTQSTFLQFSSGAYSVHEGGLSTDIVVIRTGNTSGTTTVRYATADASAQKRGDYIAATGFLIFNPGETIKTFPLLVIDDAYVEGTETLSLSLSNPSGASFGSPSSTSCTVFDNDSASPTSNPIDNPEFFVRQHYLDFLNRQPDAAGLNFWVNEINSCGSNSVCRELKRINVSAAFFLSIEFEQTGMLACLTNKAAFNGLPAIEQFEFDRQSLQRNFAFGTPGALDQLEANKQAYFNELVQRPEFVARYAGTSNSQYVDMLISNTGVSFSSSERDALINGLNVGTENRAKVLRKIAEKPGFRQAQFNRIFVLMEYFGYLKRDTDAGLDFWLNKLNSFGGNFINAEMVKAFLASLEYRVRFSSM
ncbi:MAG TPA: Calx-beta domain-containing protein [Pyrinomonadaceae bacterium]|nr:Calx-beta domain-containing protein [Pyrinomonadaceae bacterium]